MKRLISCEFNIDTASVELKFADGSMISFYCPAVEDEIVENMYQRSHWVSDYICILRKMHTQRNVRNASGKSFGCALFIVVIPFPKQTWKSK